MLEKKKQDLGVDMFLLFTKVDYIIENFAEKHNVLAVAPNGAQMPITLVVLDNTSDRVQTLVKEVVELGEPLIGEVADGQVVTDLMKFEFLSNIDKNHELPYGVVSKEDWQKLSKQLTKQK